MYLHIIQDEKFTLPFVSFLFKNFNGHFVCVYRCKDSSKYSDFKDVKIINNDDLSSLHFEEYNNVYIHGFQNNCILNLLCSNYKILKKSILIMWGADLYNNKLFLMEHKGIYPGRRLVELKKRFIIKRIAGFMTFACTDYDLAKKWYGANGKSFDCLYPSTVDVEALNKIKSEKNKNDDIIRILIGNSAAMTNNHEAVIESLSKFADKNIKIYVPLSYNIKKDYVEKIISKGKLFFGDKFIPITDFMTPAEYSKFLSTIDISIFNHNRQQATGVIEILGYLGSKIFVRSDTTTWEHYVKRDKCPFYDTIQLESMTYETFTKYSQTEIDYNEKYFSNIWDEQYLINLWNNVFLQMNENK